MRDRSLRSVRWVRSVGLVRWVQSDLQSALAQHHSRLSSGSTSQGKEILEYLDSSAGNITISD